MIDLTGLPGAGLVKRGVLDLERGVVTAEALTVRVAEARLARCGIELPPWDAPTDREIALYEHLSRSGVDDAYARYNAMLRELTSFLEAFEVRRREG